MPSDSLKSRRLEPEQLDHLRPDDPAAIRSRNDLERLNRFLGTTKNLVAELERCSRVRRPARVVELGAGDGRSSLRMLQRLGPHWRGTELVTVDQADAIKPATREEIRASGWTHRVETADVFEWIDSGSLRDGDVVVASLFIHHFTEAQIKRLFSRIRAVAVGCICAEPRRWLPALWVSRGFRWLGFSPVTCHDAVVSIRAGFERGELLKLWGASDKWHLRERWNLTGVLTFAAIRCG